MSAEVNSKSWCDWTRNAGLFLLAGSQLEAKQVRQAGAATADFDWFIRPVWIAISECKINSVHICGMMQLKPTD